MRSVCKSPALRARLRAVPGGESLMSETVTAAVVVIGNEILSGRTRDANIAFLAENLTNLGIRLKEVRVVGDVEDEIVGAVNELRHRHTYVFTTGGIGPTHDDITADSIAAAFGVGISVHPGVRDTLVAHFRDRGMEPNEARLRMARIPDGARLIDNEVSMAPGFQIGNVIVMAGVPEIARAMFRAASSGLRGGPRILSRAIRVHCGEGTIAGALGALQQDFPDVDMGSYPWRDGGTFGTSIVLRSTDRERLDAAFGRVFQASAAAGGNPVEEDAASS